MSFIVGYRPKHKVSEVKETNKKKKIDKVVEPAIIEENEEIITLDEVKEEVKEEPKKRGRKKKEV